MDPDAVPGVWSPAAVQRPPPPDPHVTQVERDGRSWPLGTAAEVAWITSGTTPGDTITAAVPPVFDAYATLALPSGAEGQARHDAALLEVLRGCGPHEWWLGYLDTGADDIVFPDAPTVTLYSDWSYVLVQAGPDEAARWRRWDPGAFWLGHLPNLIFPVDRSFLVTTLWDDEWTSLGGSASLVEEVLHHPDLRDRARRVTQDEDVPPPGVTDAR